MYLVLLRGHLTSNPSPTVLPHMETKVTKVAFPHNLAPAFIRDSVDAPHPQPYLAACGGEGFRILVLSLNILRDGKDRALVRMLGLDLRPQRAKKGSTYL